MTSRRAVLTAALAVGAGALAGCAPGQNAQQAASGKKGTAPPSGNPGTHPAPSPSKSSPAGPDITKGPASKPAVALTFHGAGDPAITRHVVEVVGAAGAHITVLAIGNWLRANPDLGKLLLDHGHDVGNHTWSHQTMPRLGVAQINDEVQRAAEVLQQVTGSIGRWFRPSGTQFSNDAIRAAAVKAGYGACLSYDLDPLDYTDPGAGPVEKRVLDGVSNGSIVSLHLGHPGTLAALPTILTGLRSKGFAAVTVSTLLGV